MAASPTDGGTTSPATGDHYYPEGVEITITATPNAGYAFVNWTSNPVTFADDEATQTTFTMPAEDVTVTANFEWIPKSISDLVIWYAADHLAGFGVEPGDSNLENGSVKQWNDLSGNNYHALRDTNENDLPTYISDAVGDLPVVGFPGEDSLFTGVFAEDVSFEIPNTIFVVVQFIDYIDSRAPFIEATGHRVWKRNPSGNPVHGGHWIMGDGEDRRLTSLEPEGTDWHILSCVFARHDQISYFFIDGEQKDQGNPVPEGAAFTWIRIGAGSTSHFGIFNIAEILVYDRALEDDERRVVETYLSTKWGISVSH